MFLRLIMFLAENLSLIYFFMLQKKWGNNRKIALLLKILLQV